MGILRITIMNRTSKRVSFTSASVVDGARSVRLAL